MTRAMPIPLRTVRPERTQRVVIGMLGALAMLSLALGSATASETCVLEPGKVRFDDKVACFEDPANRTGLWSSLKFIPLAEGVSLSVGGEVRQRYENTQNPAFGADPQDENGVWMQRLTLHGDLRVGEHLRLFGQAYHALEAGRSGGPSPVDENLFEFQNAFVELGLSPADHTSVSLRLGRQEMHLGSQRLIGVREGPNNRRNFDGARLGVTTGGWQVDGIAFRPVVPERGVLDDQTSDQEWLWGVYATGGRDLLPVGAVDLYYLGFRDDAGRFQQGTAEEERHSLGLRYFGESDGWDWNTEAVYQFGSFGSGDIRAWTLATDAGFTFADLPWQPRVGLSLNVASGDDDPGDGALGTFNPLFPRGNYFSEAAVLGPRNFFNVLPSVALSPAPGWSVSAASNFFWRLEKADAVYSPAGQMLRGPGGSAERYVGTGLSLGTSYQIAGGLEATALYSRIFAGPFIRDTGPAEDIDFVELTLQWKY